MVTAGVAPLNVAVALLRLSVPLPENWELVERLVLLSSKFCPELTKTEPDSLIVPPESVNVPTPFKLNPEERFNEVLASKLMPCPADKGSGL